MGAKITRILNPTDFSMAAEGPSRLAARLAMRTQASLIVLHVLPPEPGGAEPAPGALVDESRKQLQLWFETVVREETQRFLPIEYQVAIGAPAQGILWAVGETGADLVVMGTHGRSGVSRLLMGSVTESVMRAAPVPILALKMGERGDRLAVVRRILCATDLSPASEEARRYGLRLADVFAAEVLFVHVVPPSEIVGLGDMLVPPPWHWLERHLKPIEAALERRQREVEALGLHARRKVAVGSPADVIVKEAETEQADLIVVGTHGYTGLTQVLLGSVAEAIIRKAPCPVLAVRAKTGSEGKEEPGERPAPV
ncbi:MAG: universal stress protein [Candidatus Methylomirabilaceae bacterium]